MTDVILLVQYVSAMYSCTHMKMAGDQGVYEKGVLLTSGNNDEDDRIILCRNCMVDWMIKKLDLVYK